MKETQELTLATERRDEARAAATDTARTLRARLAPRLLAAEIAELIAAKAGHAMVKRGITRRKRVTAAIGGGVALASAIALRASHRLKAKKAGDLPDDGR